MSLQGIRGTLIRSPEDRRLLVPVHSIQQAVIVAIDVAEVREVTGWANELEVP